MTDIPSNVLEHLGSGQTAVLLEKKTVGTDTLYKLNVTSEDEGGQLVAKVDQAGNVTFPLSDAGVLEADPGQDIGANLKSALDELKIPNATVELDLEAPAGATFLTKQQLDTKLAAEGKECVNTLITADVPGTDHGNLACAWAVNEVARRALRRPIGGGLSTASMYLVLKAKHQPVKRADAIPGNIIISPTEGANIGHVGIVGDNGQIYSNSSSLQKFYNKYTLDTWQAHYGDSKGLKVLFYQLDPDQFPFSGAIS
ncbi:hypothetical protein [Mesorhizobium sp. M0589]|uniref:hypothetical protein n=1 Tax=Mesorhizobium sp. M0589 TaxID=2956965 RepID=UPI00333B803A